MDISKIISISGKPGLFKLVSQQKNGFVVEDLLKGKKMSVSTNSNVSLLENIAIYTETEEVPLADVFQKIYDKEEGQNCINHKSSEKELRAYMSEILPDYDEDRVYQSDLKKLFQWYNILSDKGLLIPIEEENKEEQTAETVKESES